MLCELGACGWDVLWEGAMVRTRWFVVLEKTGEVTGCLLLYVELQLHNF